MSGGTVADIMAAPLVCGTPEDSYAQHAEHPFWGELDQVPVADAGRIIGVALRPTDLQTELRDCMTTLSEDMLIGANTPVLDLVGADWDNSHFFLVVAFSEIAGIVTPSDLNKLPVYAALYNQVAAFEERLTTRLERTHPNESWRRDVTPEAVTRIERYYQNLVSKGFDIGRLRLLSLGTKLKLSGDIGGLDSKSIVDLRDSIAHPKPLVNSIDNIKALQRTIALLASEEVDIELPGN